MAKEFKFPYTVEIEPENMATCGNCQFLEYDSCYGFSCVVFSKELKASPHSAKRCKECIEAQTRN